MDPTRKRVPPAGKPLVPPLQDLLIEELKHVGLQAGVALRARGVLTAGMLLAHTPRRYLDLRRADDWGLVREAKVGALVALEGRVVEARGIGSGTKRGLSVLLQQPAGRERLRAVFFKAPPGMRERFTTGSLVRLVGVLRKGTPGVELVQPRIVSRTATSLAIEPVYGGLAGMAGATIARIIAAAVDRASEWEDPLPHELSRRLGLPGPAEALRAIHQPAPDLSVGALRTLEEGRSSAHKRLGLEELLAVAVVLERARRSAGKAVAIPRDESVFLRLQERLKLTATEGQRDATLLLMSGMQAERPMRALLVGEVGAGKTAVAAMVTLAALRAGVNCAWLAPTSLVAEQHAATLTKALGAEAGPIAVLQGSSTKRARTHAEKVISSGAVRLVVGTHTLLEPGAMPPNLGLVVIDEQHRFGVAQRLAMVQGRTPVPHLLVLSATPIPRTLALARYGDLDVVWMKGAPPGRQPVLTRVVRPDDQTFLVRTIERALSAHQAEDGSPSGRVFVVVPRIDPVEEMPLSLASVDGWLAGHFGRDRVAVIHGRMGAEEQREALRAFRKGSHPILLCTTVVEVGLDVPDANLMVVMGAEQFGLAQLHQLRGRVGRGGQKAACLLVPERPSEEAEQRLNDVATCHDGFVLAEKDLGRRGAGEWFGEAQSGRDATLLFADPLREPDLVAVAGEVARGILDRDPELVAHAALRRAVERLLARGVAPVAEEAG